MKTAFYKCRKLTFRDDIAEVLNISYFQNEYDEGIELLQSDPEKGRKRLAKAKRKRREHPNGFDDILQELKNLPKDLSVPWLFSGNGDAALRPTEHDQNPVPPLTLRGDEDGKDAGEGANASSVNKVEKLKRNTNRQSSTRTEKTSRKDAMGRNGEFQPTADVPDKIIKALNTTVEQQKAEMRRYSERIRQLEAQWTMVKAGINLAMKLAITIAALLAIVTDALKEQEAELKRKSEKVQQLEEERRQARTGIDLAMAYADDENLTKRQLIAIIDGHTEWPNIPVRICSFYSMCFICTVLNSCKLYSKWFVLSKNELYEIDTI